MPLLKVKSWSIEKSGWIWIIPPTNCVVCELRAAESPQKAYFVSDAALLQTFPLENGTGAN